MLVLKRKDGTAIEIKQLGIEIRVLKTRNGRVQLGITAPDGVRVTRSDAPLLPAGGENSLDAVPVTP